MTGLRIFCLGLFSAVSASAAATGPGHVCWMTLGTAGGPPIHADQAQISNAVRVGDAVYLFDVGNGVLGQMAAANLPVRNLRGVFLTHHHVDHNADLGPAMVSWWLLGTGSTIPVLGPAGTETLAQGIIAANAPTELASFPTGGRPSGPPLADVVDVRDLPNAMGAPTLVFEDDNIRVSAIDVDHFQVPPSVPMKVMPQAVAYRVEVGGRSYVFSGDTGPSENLATLAKGADVLITEVVDLEAIKAVLRQLLAGTPAAESEDLGSDMEKNHLTPTAIGKIAAAAGVGRVVLTHYVPSFEDLDDLDHLVNGVTPNYEGPVTAARDLDCF